MAQLAKSRSIVSYRNPVRNESVLNQDFLFRLDLMGAENRRKLLNDAGKIHSFDVCSVI
jgi:hypothetical protein